MPRRKANYKEGDWIALPLIRRGGWGLGIIARCKPPTIIGYFFGPRRMAPPTLEDTIGLRYQDAIVAGDVGDLGLLNGEWQVIGHQPAFHRADWPMPLFTTVDGPRLYLCTMDEDDPGRIIPLERITAEEADRRGAIPYLAHGYRALSLKLDKRLAEQEAKTAAQVQESA